MTEPLETIPQAFNPLHLMPVGTRKGLLTVVGVGSQATATSWKLRCLCDCGVEVERLPSYLRRSDDRAYCGTAEHRRAIRSDREIPPTRTPARPNKLVGQVIGRIRVIESLGYSVFKIVCLHCGETSTMDITAIHRKLDGGLPRMCLKCQRLALAMLRKRRRKVAGKRVAQKGKQIDRSRVVTRHMKSRNGVIS